MISGNNPFIKAQIRGYIKTVVMSWVIHVQVSIHVHYVIVTITWCGLSFCIILHEPIVIKHMHERWIPGPLISLHFQIGLGMKLH